MPSQPHSLRAESAKIAAAPGVLYVANSRSNSIDIYEPGKSAPSRKITSGISAPDALAVDGAGDLFVENGGDKAHASVTVYAPGQATPKLKVSDGMYVAGPMAVDPAGDLFYANHWASKVYEYAAGTTRISRTISDGVAVLQALSVDSSGYLYVSNCQSCVSPNLFNTLTAYKPKSQRPFLTVVRSPAPIQTTALDPSGNLYADVGSALEVYAKHSGRLLRTLANAAGQVLFIDRSGTLYSGGHRFFNSGGRILVFPPNASTPAYTITRGLYDTAALAEDAAGNLYAANALHNTISVYPPGSTKPSLPIVVATGVEDPQSLAFDASGNLYVANGNESTVTVYAPGRSEPHVKITKGIHGPRYSLAFDRADNLYAATGCTWLSDPITVYAPGRTSVSRTIGRSGILPCAIAFDSSGNLYVAVVGLPGQISIFAPDASTPTHVITKGVNYPEGLAFDSSGNLYVTNARGGKTNGKTWGSISIYRPGGKRPLRKIKWGLHNAPANPLFGPAGDLYVTSTDEVLIYSVDGGKPRIIRDGIRAPDSMAFDSAGILYVANDGNSTITEYEPGSSEPFRTIPPAKGYPDALVFAPR